MLVGFEVPIGGHWVGTPRAPRRRCGVHGVGYWVVVVELLVRHCGWVVGREGVIRAG